MGIKLTKKAIKAGFLVEHPNWYVLHCTEVKEKAATTGSKNYFYLFEVKCGVGGTESEMDGITVPYMANEKADWLHYPIFKALNKGVDLPENYDMNPQEVKDCTLEGFIKRGSTQEGAPINIIVDFRPLTVQG